VLEDAQPTEVAEVAPAPKVTEPPSVEGRSEARGMALAASGAAAAAPAPGGSSTMHAPQADVERASTAEETTPKPCLEEEAAIQDLRPSRASSPPLSEILEASHDSQRTRTPPSMKNGRGRTSPCSPPTAPESPGPEMPSMQSSTRTGPSSTWP
jgi:hypothetical protein